jgi:heterodisulfide reductase subunit D
MTLQNIADEFEQCFKCGLCLATCPVHKELFLEKFGPRGKIQLARYYDQGKLDLSEHYREIFMRCLLCGACVSTCPSGVNLNRVFIAIREEITKEKGLDSNVEGMARSVSSYHNISGEDNAERGDWRDFLESLPEHGYEKEEAEVAYFVGCVASFFPMVQMIPQNLVRILDRANVDFALLGGEEWCCGFPLIGAGASEGAHEMISHNLEKVRALGARRVVFSCPTCYKTWAEYYNAGLELFHSTQILERLINEGMIHLGEVNARVTYHDPCDLGRGGGEFEAPRNILKSIPGIELVELENNRARSVCCGGGGNVEVADSDLSGAVAHRKIEEILRTGARTVVSACQQCVRTIKSCARREKIDMEVLDITDMVLRAMAAA